MAISAIRVRSPDSISARRAIPALTPAALATASAITPASAPWRRSPVSSRRTNSASGSVARPSSSVEQPAPARRRSGSGVGGDLVNGPVQVGDGQRRLGGRRHIDPVDGRVADADPSLPRRPGEKPDADRDLTGIDAPQQLSQDCHLGRPRPRGGDLAGGVDDGREAGGHASRLTGGCRISSCRRACPRHGATSIPAQMLRRPPGRRA